MAVHDISISSDLLDILCDFAEAYNDQDNGFSEGQLERANVVSDMIPRLREKIAAGEPAPAAPKPAEEETPPWYWCMVSADHPTMRPQFLKYSWYDMGQGSWEGGRHNYLRWLARRGRTNFAKDIARNPASNPVISPACVLRARPILYRYYQETVEDLQ